VLRLRFVVALGLLLATIVLSLAHLALGSAQRRVGTAVAQAATAALAHRHLTGDGRRRDPSCGTLGRSVEGWTCLRSPDRPAVALHRLRSVLPGSAVSCFARATPGGLPGPCFYRAELAGGLVSVSASPHIVMSRTSPTPSDRPGTGQALHAVGSDIVVSVLDQSAG
jgi:hypothetical protein